jgi:hypothetical protein
MITRGRVMNGSHCACFPHRQHRYAARYWRQISFRDRIKYSTLEPRMKPAIAFPQYALAVWTLLAPLAVGLIEWFISRHQRSELTRPAGRPGYAD